MALGDSIREELRKRTAASIAANNPMPEDCVALDLQIAKLQNELDKVLKQAISTTNAAQIAAYEGQKLAFTAAISERRNKFALMDCRNKIETLRQNESAAAFSNTSASAEARIIGKSSTKQYLMLAAGSATLLAGMYLILNKK